MLNIPILLITFNRPLHTLKVLDAILAVQSRDLYVFQDGARKGNKEDLIRCQQVREIIETRCQSMRIEGRLHEFYSNQNLGCGPGPATAISWFFSEVEQGIIIEDDAVPHPDFFVFAETLLDRYKWDVSVRAIGSMNVDTKRWGTGSYYFSMMNRNLCAWATWRRAWKDFDLELKHVKRAELNRALRHYGCGVIERSYWCDRLAEVHKNNCEGKSWDQQFFMSIWLRKGKGIIPNVNLSSNIGSSGDEATHPMSPGNLIDNVPTCPILPIIHPDTEEICSDADREFHFRYFEPRRANWSRFQIGYYQINQKIKHITGHKGPWIKKAR